MNEAKKESEKATYNKVSHSIYWIHEMNGFSQSGNTSVTTPRKKGRDNEDTSADARKVSSELSCS